MIPEAMGRSVVFEEALAGLLTALGDDPGVETAMRLRALIDLAAGLDTDALLTLVVDLETGGWRRATPRNRPLASFENKGMGRSLPVS